MNATEMSEVLSRVKTWMPEMRIVLARKILETLVPPQISEPPRQMSLNQVFSISDRSMIMQVTPV